MSDAERLPGHVLVRELRTDPFSGRRSLVVDRGAAPAGLLEAAPGAGHAPVPDGEAVALEAGEAGPAPRARADLLHAVAADAEVVGVPLAAHREVAAGDPRAVADLLEVWRAALRTSRAPHRQAVLEVGARGARSWTLADGAVPALVARERERAGAHAARTAGGVLAEEVLQEEVKLRERVVAVAGDAVLLAAWAPRAAGHLVVLPRRSAARFEDDGPLGAESLATGLRGLRALGAGALRAFVRTAPAGADEGWCWRIELLPVLPVGVREATTDVAEVGLAPERLAGLLRPSA